MSNEFESLSKVRLEFLNHEYDLLKSFIDFEAIKKADEEAQKSKHKTDVYNRVLNMLENPKIIKFSQKKQNAIALATKIRSVKVKEKINNAINILRLQDKEFTHYNIAKEAKVSFVTVKKYLSKELIDQLNNKELEKIE